MLLFQVSFLPISSFVPSLFWCLHLIGEKTGDQRGEVTCPKTHSDKQFRGIPTYIFDCLCFHPEIIADLQKCGKNGTPKSYMTLYPDPPNGNILQAWHNYKNQEVNITNSIMIWFFRFSSLSHKCPLSGPESNLGSLTTFTSPYSPLIWSSSFIFRRFSWPWQFEENLTV